MGRQSSILSLCFRCLQTREQRQPGKNDTRDGTRAGQSGQGTGFELSIRIVRCGGHLLRLWLLCLGGNGERVSRYRL